MTGKANSQRNSPYRLKEQERSGKLYRSEAKQIIQASPGTYLKRDKCGKGYVCPLCGSGSGKNGTGITEKDGTHFTCWAGCFRHADIIDIIGMAEGLEDYNSKLRRACELYGIDYDSLEKDPDGLELPDVERTTAKEDPADYMDFFKECRKHIKETDYMEKRGLSFETLKHFGIGYCERWQSPTSLKRGQTPPYTPRIIIPTGHGSYLARDTRTGLNDREKKYSKMKEGKAALFHLKPIEDGKDPVFVTEGEIDAMSLEEVGVKACALGSVAQVPAFVRFLEKVRPEKPLIIALDNDDPGREASAKLAEELKRLAISFKEVAIYGDCKDANERLVKDREGLKADALEAARACMDEDEKSKYQEESNANYLQGFLNGVAEGVDTPFIPTGFNTLDEVLGGGLYEGLYVIGAISSLGKTTFSLQVGDQIAAGQDTDVLIFSLEMARNELIAKSISRNTAVISLGRGNGTRTAKDTRGVTVGKFYRSYTPEEKEIINTAVERYREYAGHIYIREAMGDITAPDIRSATERHITLTGCKPVVIVDYLQILAPTDERIPEKRSIDKAVVELKRMSRDLKIPVIVISSYNRSNYNVAASMAAFKESGGIEYGADVLIGLQLAGVNDPGFDVDREKDKNPREVEAVILKNRNGRTGQTLQYKYYPAFNLFTEAEESAGDGVFSWDDEIGDGDIKHPRRSKREKERERLLNAFIACKDGEGRAALLSLADHLDKSQRQVKSMITDLGVLEEADGVVTRKGAGNA